MSDFAFNFDDASDGAITLTDPTESRVLPASDYPTTFPNGVTAGWCDDLSATPGHFGNDGRQWDNAAPLETCGMMMMDGTSTRYFRIALDAAEAKTIRAAHGDHYPIASPGGTITYFDNATSFASLNIITTSNFEFWDASGVKRTSRADWDTNNASISHTFASTVFHIKIGDGATANRSPISHVRFTSAAAGATSYLPPYNPMAHMLVR